MTTPHAFGIRKDPTKEKWESNEMPILCETCLGDNPYIRMTKENFGKACKICERPFTAFRWRPGQKARFKSTQICQSCAKSKNVCQTCILDLQYGLPVEVRDAYIAKQEKVVMPQSKPNARWFATQQDSGSAPGGVPAITDASTAPAGVSEETHKALMRMSRQQPYYKRNLPHKCSFYAKGECTRGDKCPFLHEMPTSKDDPLANQNLRDRFYGQEDPVAAKMMARARRSHNPGADGDESGSSGGDGFSERALRPPEDMSIRSLYVGGLNCSLPPEETAALGSTSHPAAIAHHTRTYLERLIRAQLTKYGSITDVAVLLEPHCMAFVEFERREMVQAALDDFYKLCKINGQRVQLAWSAKSKEQHEREQQGRRAAMTGAASGASAGGGRAVPVAASGTVGGAAAPAAAAIAVGVAVPPPPATPQYSIPAVGAYVPPGYESYYQHPPYPYPYANYTAPIPAPPTAASASAATTSASGSASTKKRSMAVGNGKEAKAGADSEDKAKRLKAAVPPPPPPPPPRLPPGLAASAPYLYAPLAYPAYQGSAATSGPPPPPPPPVLPPSYYPSMDPNRIKGASHEGKST